MSEGSINNQEVGQMSKGSISVEAPIQPPAPPPAPTPAPPAAAPKTRRTVVPPGGGGADTSAGGAEVSEDIDKWLTAKTILKPDDQLELTDVDLQEEFPRVLSQGNPQLPDNPVEWSHRARSFISMPITTQVQHFYSLQGITLHKDSEEAQAGGAYRISVMDEPPTPPEVYEEDMGTDEEEMGEAGGDEEEMVGEEEEGEEVKGEMAEGEEEEEDRGEEYGEEEESWGEEEEEEGGGKKKKKKKKGGEPEMKAPGAMKITNKFNFLVRPAQTFNYQLRLSQTQTQPPPREPFSRQVTQYIIYDDYAQDFAAKEEEKEKEKERKERTLAAQIQTAGAGLPGADQSQLQRKREKEPIVEPGALPPITKKMLNVVKVLERMVNQNIFDEIGQDFRYWEDPADEYREKEGMLLPLWKFVYEKTYKKNTVTDIRWNPSYFDMFAVSYGSFDFLKGPNDGCLCLYTLKNPAYPEYVCMTDTVIICVDIHPDHPHLVVVGKSDGNVAVYNAQMAIKEPQFKSNSVKYKHSGVVWQVRWAKDLPDGEMSFYSIGSDGYVCNWIITSNGMAKTPVIALVLEDLSPCAGPDGTTFELKGCGTAVAFHPDYPHIFLVGTEEGFIHKCSTLYTSKFLFTYKAHYMAVHKIDYNKYYPAIFMSCSAGWEIKIWDDNREEPLWVFDVRSPVGDCEWSPHNSTVFAAVTTDGKCHVFDINVDKYLPICSQAVVSKKRNQLTRMAFNSKLPVIVVGDVKGTIITLKLSPNLRKKVKPPKKGPQVPPRELELQKLEKLLALVREPRVLDPPEDKEVLSSEEEED